MDSLDLFVYLKHGYIERNYYNSMLRNCLAWRAQQTDWVYFTHFLPCNAFCNRLAIQSVLFFQVL